MIKTQTRDWKPSFDRWARPPSQTELDRCANAESMVRKAIQASTKLQSRDVSVFTHGSYTNRTNVRTNSDVDVAVACGSVFYSDVPTGMSRADFGLTGGGNYTYSEFKNDVQEALQDYFGRDAVKRGNKAFDIHETSYHVEADVAPFVNYRYYFKSGGHRKGYVLYPDQGDKIKNYPHQHYDNGVSKNDVTSQRFKKVARILKGICYEMQDEGSPEALVTPGFLLECLAGLTPDNKYGSSDLIRSTRDVAAWLYLNTKPECDCSEWTELNGAKWLFRSSQPWTQQSANAFLIAMWRHVGFTNE